MSSPALALDGLRPSATNSPPPHANHQNLGGLASPTSRASLLSGLRTGGVRSPSPSPLMEQQMQHHQQQDSEAGSPTSFGPPSPKNSAYHRRLKASAAIFTPNSPLAQKILNGQDQVSVGSPNGSQHDSPKSASFSNASLQHHQSPQGSPVNRNHNGGNGNREREMQALEDQMVAMRMQALAEQNAANVAALYGAARGQPNHELQQLRLQQQQQQQMQLEILRLQALQQHQQQQAALAAQQQQQQHLLAQIHAEYERQMAAERERGSPSQEQQHIFGGNSEVNSASSAQEQRQAAQASIQASLRNRSDRQAQQAQLQQKEFYLAMLQQQQAQAQQQGGYTQEEMVQVQQMLMLQHQQQEQAQQQQQWMAQQLAAQQQQAESRSSGTPPSASASPPPSEARNWRSSNVNGNGNGTASPAQQAQAGKRDRVASSADKSISWRNKGGNPSIVIDDSASDTTDGASGMSQSDSENHHGDGETTPETSEEDLNVKTPLRRKSNTKEAQPFGKGIPTPTQASHALSGVLERNASQPIHFVQPRAISLAAAPRNRAFAEASSSSSTATAAPVQPRRQPKGPPTEFKEVNFAARISARTRREAVNRLNKLCKSPRTVAAFSRNVSAPVA